MKASSRQPRRSRPSFSVTTIVRNEGPRLPRLLESLAGFRVLGGEVVVLDTGSEDETVSVAREAGCVVTRAPRRFHGTLTQGQAERIHQAFSRCGEGPFLRSGERLFNFAAARNHAASLGRHAYELAVDGTDVVDALDLDFVEAAIKSGSPQVLRFETRRRHGARFMIELRDYFHDRRTTEWFGRAHNVVTGLERKPLIRTTLLPPDRLRVTHHTDEAKPRGYQLAGVALDALSRPRDPYRSFLVGRELGVRGHHASALALFLALDRADVPAVLRSAALCMAATCVAAKLSGGASAGDDAQDEVRDLWFKASVRDPSRRDPLLHLARHALSRGDHQAAASFATAALAIPPRVGFSEPEANLREAPHAILYWALLWLGRRSEARSHYEICRRLDPSNPTYEGHAQLFYWV